jgi:hypothetical protein
VNRGLKKAKPIRVYRGDCTTCPQRDHCNRLCPEVAGALARLVARRLPILGEAKLRKRHHLLRKGQTDGR